MEWKVTTIEIPFDWNKVWPTTHLLWGDALTVEEDHKGDLVDLLLNGEQVPESVEMEAAELAALMEVAR